MTRLDAPFVIDWSAYARVLLAQRPDSGRRLPAPVVERFTEAVARGAVWVCPPFRLEALYSASGAADFEGLRAELDALPQAVADGDSWAVAERAQVELAAARGVSHRVKIVDLLVAAVASRAGLPVVHYDHAYDVIASHSSLDFDSIWIAPRGSVD